MVNIQNKTVWSIPPQEIESRSFAIIDSEAGEHTWDPKSWSVVRRLIHTTADFDYVKDTRISPGAIEAGITALQNSPLILTDTKMALNGINRYNLAKYNPTLTCLVDHELTLKLSQKNKQTRSLAAVDLAFRQFIEPNKPVIWVIGNAPTALYGLLEKLQSDASLPKPSLVVALPVGFVNAWESKKDLVATANFPYITNDSRKGGSNVAAAAINALAKLANLA
ncbi:MAG: precorrin-8X methylmutase [Deltaproteobacteria bacterium]|jgi:precorrin-8X/cobalt-precorrin-8 methylmutase|nr:precorrin-8X methylmutase [Deltaproteobacteria bacterium]